MRSNTQNKKKKSYTSPGLMFGSLKKKQKALQSIDNGMFLKFYISKFLLNFQQKIVRKILLMNY